MAEISTNTKFHIALQMLNNVKPEEILDDKVQFTTMMSGKTHYFLMINENVSIADIARDCFSPWSGTDRFGKKESSNISYRPVEEFTDGFQITKQTTDKRLKIVRNCHPSFDGLKRELFYVEIDKEPVTPILFIYSSMHELNVPSVNTQRILPSRSKMLKNALSFRTSRSAKNFLEKEGIFVDVAQLSSMSRSVESHIKTKIGRKAPMSFHKIMDRYVDKKNPDELMETPFIETRENGKTIVRVIVGFPKAFRNFGMGLPTREDVLDHRKEVSRIFDMSDKEADQFCGTFLESVNVSGALPCLGSCVMLDTTFSLCSSELVTVAIGVSDVFRSEKSGKSASVLLAYMVHTSKEIDQHEAFASFINKMLIENCENKCINLLVHDGEASFRVYNTGSFLKDCIVIRCDVHRMNNLKQTTDSNDEFEYVKGELFGTKRNLPEGLVVRKGVLHAFSRADFDRKMDNLIAECLNEKTEKWLDDNREDLYKHNSMVKKLMGGWPAQFLSTNIIESKNSFLKTLITCKKPAQKVLDDFLHIHKEDMNERIRSVCGKSSKYITDFSISLCSWLAKTSYEKAALLATFGLENPFFLDEMEDIPSWALSTKVSKTELVMSMKDFISHRSESDISSFFVMNVKNPCECFHVLYTQDELRCFGYNCKKKSVSRFCVHSLIVHLSLDKHQQEIVLQKMDLVRSNRSCSTILREQMRPHHGTKHKRIGKSFSHGNYSRRYAAIVDTTSTSIEEDL